MKRTVTEKNTAEASRLDDLPDVLTIEEAGRVMRIGRNSAYEAAADGTIPTVRIGRCLRVPKSALAKMLAGSA